MNTEQTSKTIFTYINLLVSKTYNHKTMLLSQCAICGTKKSKFIKKHEAKGILTV